MAGVTERREFGGGSSNLESESYWGQHQLLYFTAPSRSGSTLLGTMLNSGKGILIINEPLNSYKIGQGDILDGVFKLILADYQSGFARQRLGNWGEEVTDTFPSDATSWQEMPVTYVADAVVGIKKSFPSLGNRDYHLSFIEQWGSFVEWFNRERNGKILTIVRNPIFTLLSWKTTFEALRAETIEQAEAWNRIARAILETRESLCLVRYEDVIARPREEIKRITGYLGRDFAQTREFPSIREDFNSPSSYRQRRGLSGEVEADLEIIAEVCGPIASYFGYDLESDKRSLMESA
ncbi:MAG: sulfotransferase [Candidatus Shapirobacteria bacterium]